MVKLKFFKLTVCIADLISSLEGQCDYNTSNHESVVGLRDVDLTPIL